MASLHLARASVEITSATRWTRSVSHVAARPMAWGKTVAFPARATPCRPSFHQLYTGMPRRGMAGATSCICEAFSSRVMRETRSFTRSSRGRLGSRYGAAAGSLVAGLGEGACAAERRVLSSKKSKTARSGKNRLDTAEILSQSVHGVHSRLRWEIRGSSRTRVSRLHRCESEKRHALRPTRRRTLRFQFCVATGGADEFRIHGKDKGSATPAASVHG